MTLLLLLSAAPVSARPPDREPVPDARDEYAAGVVCAFPTLIETTANKEKATTFYDREGNVVRQLVTGKLRMRITNTATGESIDVNVSGPGNPPKRNRNNPRDYDRDLYQARHLIEIFVAFLKQY